MCGRGHVPLDTAAQHMQVLHHPQTVLVTENRESLSENMDK